MLLKIRDYIQQHGHVSTHQIQREFHIDAAALEPMLAQWVRKGVIHMHTQQGCKKTCGGCRPSSQNKWDQTHWISLTP